MAQIELLLPKMGESVAEATITNWLKKPGDTIQEDEAVVEISTDKVDSEVPSPVSGKLVKQIAAVDDVVRVGSVIAIIETEEEEKELLSGAYTEVAKDVAEETELSGAIPGVEHISSAQMRHNDERPHETGRFYSPLVRSIAAQEGISAEDLNAIPGTGLDGRVTKEDIIAYIRSAEKRKSDSSLHAERTEPIGISHRDAKVNESVNLIQPSSGDEIIEMDRMRRLIAEHMVMSKKTSPHVTSFIEADVTNIVKWREKTKIAFETREGEKLTYTPIFIQAVAKAIKDMPMINVSVDGNRIIKKRDINIGMATALPSGNLIVPVIKNADQLNLLGLSLSVNDLASRARNNKLKPDEVANGTFTITNIGTFGNIMGVPIINQPQVAILAIGAIQKKPAVIETEFGDVIAIRHKIFLSMSYDHRVVDGALGGMFLKRVSDYLEGWNINSKI